MSARVCSITESQTMTSIKLTYGCNWQLFTLKWDTGNLNCLKTGILSVHYWDFYGFSGQFHYLPPKFSRQKSFQHSMGKESLWLQTPTGPWTLCRRWPNTYRPNSTVVQRCAILSRHCAFYHYHHYYLYVWKFFNFKKIFCTCRG